VVEILSATAYVLGDCPSHEQHFVALHINLLKSRYFLAPDAGMILG
jgi:hypothetical protein